jgi:hypothetical protein
MVFCKTILLRKTPANHRDRVPELLNIEYCKSDAAANQLIFKTIMTAGEFQQGIIPDGEVNFTDRDGDGLEKSLHCCHCEERFSQA